MTPSTRHFYEIEASRRWTLDGALTGGPSAHLLRRIWNGESPNEVLKVSDWTEWSATVFYEPRDQTPGADIKLIAMARLSRGAACSASPLSQDEVLLQLTRGRESHRMHSIPRPVAGPVDPNAAQFFRRLSHGSPRGRATSAIRQPLVYGPSLPLQHRQPGKRHQLPGVSQAIKALGIDYVFATEHASNSRKITEVYWVFVSTFYVFPDGSKTSCSGFDFLRTTASVPVSNSTRFAT